VNRKLTSFSAAEPSQQRGILLSLRQLRTRGHARVWSCGREGGEAGGEGEGRLHGSLQYLSMEDG
jgi:hypothetical protein